MSTLTRMLQVAAGEEGGVRCRLGGLAVAVASGWVGFALLALLLAVGPGR